MDKESFIQLLQRSSPNDIREFLMKKGKRKLILPFIFEEGYSEADLLDSKKTK